MASTWAKPSPRLAAATDSQQSFLHGIREAVRGKDRMLQNSSLAVGNDVPPSHLLVCLGNHSQKQTQVQATATSTACHRKAKGLGNGTCEERHAMMCGRKPKVVPSNRIARLSSQSVLRYLTRMYLSRSRRLSPSHMSSSNMCSAEVVQTGGNTRSADLRIERLVPRKSQDLSTTYSISTYNTT